MLIDVIPTADAVTPERVAGATVLVVDVLRASTTIIAALAHGADGVVPVAEIDEARRRATAGALVAGERRGEKIDGFDLGNSPVEFAVAPVAGRTVVFTTSNGTRALLAVRSAAVIAIAALVNRSAAAEWAAAQRRDITIVCAGDWGALSLEDHVCAGLLVESLIAHLAPATLTPSAEEARHAARPYARDLARLTADAKSARRLTNAGHGSDVRACLVLDTTSLVPVYAPDIDKVVLTFR